MAVKFSYRKVQKIRYNIDQGTLLCGIPDLIGSILYIYFSLNRITSYSKAYLISDPLRHCNDFYNPLDFFNCNMLVSKAELMIKKFKRRKILYNTNSRMMDLYGVAIFKLFTQIWMRIAFQICRVTPFHFLFFFNPRSSIVEYKSPL